MKYLVKETSIATEDNPNYAGAVTVTYFGKGDTILKQEGLARFDRMSYMLERYGYDKKSDAKRNWSYKHPENTKYWRSTVEIIEVE